MANETKPIKARRAVLKKRARTEVLAAELEARREALESVRNARIKSLMSARKERKEVLKANRPSQNCVRITIVGRKPICFRDVSESETIGTLTAKVAQHLGVDEQNWGFYIAGPREFLPDSARVQDINHNKNLHFLPRTVIG